MSNVSENNLPYYEFNKYLSIDTAKFGVEGQSFEIDKCAAIKFWYERRNQFPCLYKTSVRVFSTPMSSSKSESFSVQKTVVPSCRATLPSTIIENIIVIRSLRGYSM